MPLDIPGWVFYVFAAVSSLYVVHIGLYLIAANVYDIIRYRTHHDRRTRPDRVAAHNAPLVSVCIAAHNEELVIARCLESVIATTYPNIEVLVANDASKDLTQKIVRDFMLRHPAVSLRVCRMKRNVGKGEALNTVLRRYARGTYVMTLDADSVLRPETITNAVAYFDNPNVAGVAANVQIMEEHTVLGILQKFEHMIGYRSKKAYSVLNCEFVVGGVASTYRMDVLRKVGFYDTDTLTEDIGLSIKIANLGNKKHRLVYGVDVVAMTEGVATFKALAKQRYRWKYGSLQNLIKYAHLLFNPSRKYTRTLTLYRIPLAFISELVLFVSPLVWTYAAYMSLTQYDNSLAIGAYLTITLYTLVTLWLDENLLKRERARLSPYTLISYFVFYIMDLVQLIAIARCLLRTHALVTKQKVASRWVSPARKGSQAARA